MVSPVGGGSRVRQRYSGRKRYLQWESTAKCERLHPKLLNYYTVENRRWRWRQFSPGERDWERCICVYEGKARKIVCKETIKHHLISRISSALKSKIIYYFLARGVLVKKVDKHRCEPITQSRGAGLLVQRSRTAYKSWWLTVTRDPRILLYNIKTISFSWEHFSYDSMCTTAQILLVAVFQPHASSVWRLYRDCTWNNRELYETDWSNGLSQVSLKSRIDCLEPQCVYSGGTNAETKKVV